MPRTIVITGASDGIGAAAARRLRAQGERVVVVGRDPDKTRAIGRELGASTYVVDFADLSQVRDLADAVRADHPRIDVLANNAGGVFGTRTTTMDGFETTFQVNHLAAFLLTNLLMDRLIESSAAVIQTSSRAARLFARFDIDDLQGERSWSPGTSYGNSKLANLLFTRELDRRFRDHGLSAVAFHPGVVASSFAATSGGAWRALYANPLARRLLSSSDDGGARLVDLVDGVPGRTWRRGGFVVRGRAARLGRIASDAGIAAEFWRRSAAMVGLPAT